MPAAGVPLRTPAALKLTPFGKVLVMLNVGAGNPLAIIAKLPDAPTKTSPRSRS